MDNGMGLAILLTLLALAAASGIVILHRKGVPVPPWLKITAALLASFAGGAWFGRAGRTRRGDRPAVTPLPPPPPSADELVSPVARDIVDQRAADQEQRIEVALQGPSPESDLAILGEARRRRP